MSVLQGLRFPLASPSTIASVISRPSRVTPMSLLKTEISSRCKYISLGPLNETKAVSDWIDSGDSRHSH